MGRPYREPALRPVGEADGPFLFRLFASTRAPELAALGWTAAQEDAFLRMQAEAQRRSYGLRFPEAHCSVVLRGGLPIGRLIVDRSGRCVHLVDIVLLPEHRGGGIGTALIRGLQAEAAQGLRPIRLHVRASNRAAALYERLGFTPIGDSDFDRLMEWDPRARGQPPGLPGQGSAWRAARSALPP